MKSWVLVTALALTLAPSHAAAEIADSAASGFTYKARLSLPAAPELVYQRLLAVGEWWNSEHTFSGDARNMSLDARPMGCWCEKLPNGGGVRHMQVVAAMPGKMLVMTGGLGPLQSLGSTGSMTWKLSPEGEGTRLEITYAVTGYLPGGMNTWAGPVDSVLSLQFARFRNYVETGNPVASKGPASDATQEQKIAERPKLDISKMHDQLPDKEYSARARDASFVAPNGERVQRLEIVVPATREQVWQAMSTSEGLRGWVAPNTDVEMKTGGHYYTNYNPRAKIGDPGTIYNTVLAYIPLEMVAIHVKLGGIFPEPVAKADRLSAVLRISPAGKGRVRVSETMTGWQSGEDWDKVYQFFQVGNAYTLGQLYKRFVKGPRQWKTP